MRKVLPFSAALAVLAIILSGGAAAQPALQPCGQPELGVAECGTVTVPERPGSGRTVALDIMILRATGEPKAPDPLFVLQGGPGQATTPQADFYARIFASLRARRDIYLIDARGTGRSASLHCTVRAGAFLPIEDVRACRAQLAPRADLTAYTTRRIVADLEQIRRRFGLPAVNLYGTSYGTRVALEYMRLHPRSVRTATLSGVVPAQNDAPAEYGRFAEDAFARFAALCRADPACAAAYPDPAADLAAAQAAIASAYARGATAVSPALFGELSRMELYAPSGIARLFGALRAAAGGDLGFWEGRAERLAGLWSPEGLSLGMFLSVTCADFMPRVDPERARRLGAGTFAGSYRYEQQAAACAVWNVPPTPAGFAAPVRSLVPTLLISGEFDPVTPPQWGRLAARTLANGRAVVIRNNGHSIGPASECVVGMMQALIDRRDAGRIDAGCADDLAPPSFRAE